MKISEIDAMILARQIDDLTALTVSPILAKTDAEIINFKLQLLNNYMFSFVIRDENVLASMTALYKSFGIKTPTTKGE